MHSIMVTVQVLKSVPSRLSSYTAMHLLWKIVFLPLFLIYMNCLSLVAQVYKAPLCIRSACA